MKKTLIENSNYLICGDSTKGESYLEILPQLKAKLLLADPPYCLLERRNKKTGQLRDPKIVKINHQAITRYPDVKSYKQFTKSWMKIALPYIEDNGILCVWTNFLGKKPIIETASELGFNYFHTEILWAKLTKEGSGNELLARLYEVALVFMKDSPQTESSDSDLPELKSIITHYDEEKEADLWGLHPNHKPYSSLAPIIRQFTRPGDRILDPFTGSGSTPAAAIKLGRKISGIELREEYAAITQKRAILEGEMKKKNLKKAEGPIF